MNLLSLSILAVFLFNSPGCLESEGIEEPIDYHFTILTRDTAQGKVPGVDESKLDVSVVELIGAVCVRPHAHARIISHHEILHRELNACLSRENRRNLSKNNF